MCPFLEGGGLSGNQLPLSILHSHKWKTRLRFTRVQSSGGNFPSSVVPVPQSPHRSDLPQPPICQIAFYKKDDIGDHSKGHVRDLSLGVGGGIPWSSDKLASACWRLHNHFTLRHFNIRVLILLSSQGHCCASPPEIHASFSHHISINIQNQANI